MAHCLPTTRGGAVSSKMAFMELLQESVQHVNHIESTSLVTWKERTAVLPMVGRAE